VTKVSRKRGAAATVSSGKRSKVAGARGEAQQQDARLEEHASRGNRTQQHVWSAHRVHSVLSAAIAIGESKQSSSYFICC
jgi:hypothetical protein